MVDQIEDSVQMQDPYIDHETKEVVSTFTHYLKVRDVELTQDVEGAISFDLDNTLFEQELKQFNLTFEKFFIVTAKGL